MFWSVRGTFYGLFSVSAGYRARLAAASAAGKCRGARALLLAEQPRLPDETKLVRARASARECHAELQKVLADL